MIDVLIKFFTLVAKWLLSLLPVGVTIPSAVADKLVELVGFVRNLDPILATETEIACIKAILLYQVVKVSFRATVWAYQRVRGG